MKVEKWTKVFLVVLLICGVCTFFATRALAGGDDHHENNCDHPHFQEVGCTYPGEQGPPGEDGKDGADGKDGSDGADGKDGRDGIDGVDGIDGRNGIDGKDGVVPVEWINETRNWQRNWGRFSAATEAIQVHLPQEQSSRVTFGASQIDGNTGLGVGYAYMNKDGVAFTLGLGTSGGQTVGKASVGFEFGGQRPMRLDMSKVVTVTPTSTPTPTTLPEPAVPAGAMVVWEEEYNELTAQAVQKEELEEYIEQQEYRYSQQQNQLDAIKSEREKNDAELARLKAEAEALRKEQEAAAARRAAINKRLTEKGSKDGN